MVTIEKANAALQAVQASPTPAPQQAAPQPKAKAPAPAQPKPVSKPKSTPKFVPKQSEPKPVVDIKNIIAERERRLQAAQFEAQQRQLQEKHDNAMKVMIEQAAEKLKKLAEYITDNTHLIARDYEVHEATNRITVKIYDSVTGEIIREIPGKDFLDRVYRMEQMMGMMFDKLI